MSQKVSLIRLKTTATNKIDLAKKVVSTAVHFWGLSIDDMALSETEKNVLAYFIVYGIDNKCKDLIVKASVCKNIANINTIMVKLKKLQLIYKDELNSKNYVCKQLNFEVTPEIGLLFKIETK